MRVHSSSTCSSSQINYFRKLLVWVRYEHVCAKRVLRCVWSCTCAESMERKSLGLTALGRLKQENYCKCEVILGHPNLQSKNNIWETGNEGKKHKINENLFSWSFLSWVEFYSMKKLSISCFFMFYVFLWVFFLLSMCDSHYKMGFQFKKKVYLKMKIK